MKIMINGGSRDERSRILEIIYLALDADGAYIRVSGEYPMAGSESWEEYYEIEHKDIFPDMSVKACLDRYTADRNRILEKIRSGIVSASMSGIEYYHYEADELFDKDQEALKSAMTWNGVKHISRTDWLAEYKSHEAQQ